MIKQGAAQPVDELLLPYLSATDEPESERLLARLFEEHAGPLVRGIVRRKLRVSFEGADGRAQNQDALEIEGEVYALLLSSLRALKSGGDTKPVADLRAYLAVVAYHACYKYLRQKYPRRHSLKNKLRYLLTHHAAFALWEDAAGEWLCGLAAWRGQPEKRAPSFGQTQESQARATVSSLAAASSRGFDPQRTPLAELVAALFGETRGPVKLDELVSAVASLQGIKDEPARSNDDDESARDPRAELTDPAPAAVEEVDRRDYLGRLWAEVRQLPPRQRAALLLNLRDERGRDVVFLLPLTGVATLREIAAALEVGAEELAALWNDLPLEDARIAARLGATRQQVINLRKCARERLARRMRGVPR
jgi:DNA-directed RNA polymerase specialized sigma24 family protein